MNQYEVKGTFFLNSGTFDVPGTLTVGGVTVDYYKISENEVNRIYTKYGHEVASHSLTHGDQRLMDIQQISDEINLDVANLERITNKEVIGYAYPGGFLTDLMYDGAKNHSTVKYARSVTSTNSFDVPTDWYEWNPTCCFIEDQAPALVNRFLNTSSEKDEILYIWGHSFQCDLHENGWSVFENLLEQLSGKADVEYATNGEIYNYFNTSITD